jgi:hypothetical protein
MLNLPPFTLVHVLLSLVGIATGFVVVFGLINSKRLDGWTGVFLATTAATSLTGFFLPAAHFMPSHGVGIISLIVLAIAIPALYLRHLAGGWRRTYVITCVIALYLNFFVLIVQSFQKIEALRTLAPTQSEPPFVVAQVAALALFVLLGTLAAIKFRSEPLSMARSARASG